MTVLLRTSSQLHVPMYFFVSHHSFLDISSSVTPNLLLGLLAAGNISFSRCLAQFLFFAAFGSTEAILLAAVACDRHLAIRQPPRRLAAMSGGVRVPLVGSCAAGGLNALVRTSALLLWPKPRRPFLLRNAAPHAPLVLRHPARYHGDGCVRRLRRNHLGLGCCCLLCLHPADHPGHPPCGGQTQSLLHLHLPPHGCRPLLRLSCIPIPFPDTEDQGKAASTFNTVVTPVVNHFTHSLRNRLRRAVNKLLAFVDCRRSCCKQSKADITAAAERAEEIRVTTGTRRAPAGSVHLARCRCCASCWTPQGLH